METSYHENYIKQLQRLLNTVAKSEKRLIEAADHTNSKDYKKLFDRYADERITIMSELKEAIIDLGGNISNATETEIGTPHASNDNSSHDIKQYQAVLERLRNSERETLDAYDDVLQGSILEDFNLKTLLMGHRLTINEAFIELDKLYFALFKLSQPY